MAEAQALLDLEILEETAEFGIEDLRDLIEVYLAQATEVMTQICTSIESGQDAEVNRLAHRLAGSSAACGAMAVMESLRQLEQQTAHGSAAEAIPLVQQIVQQIGASESKLAEYLKEKHCSLRVAFAAPKLPQPSHA